jgi:hypothetical protein
MMTPATETTATEAVEEEVEAVEETVEAVEEMVEAVEAAGAMTTTTWSVTATIAVS